MLCSLNPITVILRNHYHITSLLIKYNANSLNKAGQVWIAASGRFNSKRLWSLQVRAEQTETAHSGTGDPDGSWSSEDTGGVYMLLLVLRKMLCAVSDWISVGFSVSHVTSFLPLVWEAGFRAAGEEHASTETSYSGRATCSQCITTGIHSILDI